MSGSVLDPPRADPGIDARIRARRIEVPVIERHNKLLLRVSHHFYTTEEEIDSLAGALPEVLASCRECR